MFGKGISCLTLASILVLLAIPIGSHVPLSSLENSITVMFTGVNGATVHFKEDIQYVYVTQDDCVTAVGTWNDALGDSKTAVRDGVKKAVEDAIVSVTGNKTIEISNFVLTFEKGYNKVTASIEFDLNGVVIASSESWVADMSWRAWRVTHGIKLNWREDPRLHHDYKLDPEVLGLDMEPYSASLKQQWDLTIVGSTTELGLRRTRLLYGKSSDSDAVKIDTKMVIAIPYVQGVSLTDDVVTVQGRQDLTPMFSISGFLSQGSNMAIASTLLMLVFAGLIVFLRKKTR